MRVSTGAKEIGGIKTAKFIAAPALALADSLYDEEKFREAKEVLLDEMRKTDGDTRLAAVVLYARTECGEGNARAAVDTLVEHYPLADASRDDQLRAWFHATLGGAYHLLKLLDRAEYEYLLSTNHSARANDFDVVGCIENNLGFIAGQLGRGEDAREHFASARSLLAGHPVKLAEVNDTEAQVCMLEGNWREAFHLALKANLVFVEHGEKRLLRASRSTLIAAASSDAVSDLEGESNY